MRKRGGKKVSRKDAMGAKKGIERLGLGFLGFVGFSRKT
jgi:hypothetical protein